MTLEIRFLLHGHLEVSDPLEKVPSYTAIGNLICSRAWMALQVFGQQRSWVQGLLNYEHEVFALVCLLLDNQSLRNLDATFAESLYGLRRQHCTAASHRHHHDQQQQFRQQQQGQQHSQHKRQSAEQVNGRLPLRQRNLALLCQVGVGHQGQAEYQSHCGAALDM